MKEIPITQGKIAIVDDENYERINAHKWQAHFDRCNCYATRTEYGYGSKRKKIWMHREIMNAHDWQEVDHIKGNGLDNRESNLRLCTRAENAMNRRRNSNNISGFKGVTWNKLSKRWRGLIRVNDTLVHLGLFDSVNDAARSYNQAAIKYFGEFARLNIIPDKDKNESTQKIQSCGKQRGNPA